MKRILLVLSCTLALGLIFSCRGNVGQAATQPKYEVVTTPADSLLAEKILSSLVAQRNLPTPELMFKAASDLLGQPYVAGTLEGGDHEQVRVYLTQTDCILYVETVMDLAITAKQGKATFPALAENIRLSRYRDGVAENYSDRIHYTTEWIRQGEKRGILRDITLDLGGEVYDHPISYMSRHPSSYKHLKDAQTDPVSSHDLEVISQVEKTLNETPMTYIPQDRIAQAAPLIKTGDIIAYMSTVEGLDIAHVVMAYVQDDPSYPNGKKVGFMHASMGKMQVIVDPKSIEEYVKASRSINGIKVMRVKDDIR